MGSHACIYLLKKGGFFTLESVSGNTDFFYVCFFHLISYKIKRSLAEHAVEAGKNRTNTRDKLFCQIYAKVNVRLYSSSKIKIYGCLMQGSGSGLRNQYRFTLAMSRSLLVLFQTIFQTLTITFELCRF